MTIATSTAPPGQPPLLLPPDLRLSPEPFEGVCAANPEAVLELEANGRLIASTPTGGDTGARNARLLMRLQLWADRHGGWVVLDSSTGFRLPDGSVRSPDASMVRHKRWQALTEEQSRCFPPLCLEGAQLGWLLLPEEEAVEIWPAAGDPQRLEGPAASRGTRC